MLDFSKFIQEKKSVVPILRNQFQYQRKKYSVETTEDGWYRVSMKGNDAKVEEKFYGPFEEDQYNFIRGYVYNDKLIFQNFDVGKRKLSKDIQCEFLFNEAQTFNSVKCIIWEDGKVYYAEIDYSDSKIYEIKSKYDSEELIDSMKGISPELRTLCLFHDIERQQLKAAQEALKKKQEKDEYLKTIPGRLTTTFRNAGATLHNYSKQKYRGRNCLIVRWSLDSTGTEFESVIDSETFRTVEAGYCMSGDDEKHSLSSMVMTAKNYDDQGLIYITRR